jgi:hypothetical protein
MTGLRISPTLTLPLDAVTETFVVVAKRGSGKTYTAAVMAEEMLKAGLPVCVIDPLGVFWGLRSSADGKGDGFPVVIFGGEHADVPLEEGAGALIADVLIDQRFPAVLDLSLLSKAAARRFMTAFLTRLYHRNRDPLHVIVDEADLFAPQSTGRGTGGEAPALLGAMEDLVRRGRARGLGCTLITQRPAVLHKDVLSQAEVLVALRMTGVRDVAAIDEWVKLHADDDTAREVKKSLPSLPIGTAWVWSPGWLDVLQRVEVRRRTTFDSSATPKMGERRAVPKRMADVDLKALGEQIAATVDKAKADDPKALRARIVGLEGRLVGLEKELAAERAKPAPEPEVVATTIEVPVLDPDNVEQIRVALGPVLNLMHIATKTLEEHQAWLGEQEAARDRREDVPRARPASRRPDPVAAPRPQERPDPPARREPSRPTVPGSPAVEVDPLSASQQKIVDAIAWLNEVGFDRPTKQQVGFIAGYRVGKNVGGRYGNLLGSLRSARFLDYPSPGTVHLTDLGRAAAVAPDIAPTTAGLQQAVLAQLDNSEQRVLQAVIEVYPLSLTKQEVGARAGYEVGLNVGGRFGNILGRLRTLGLIDYPEPGYAAACDVLFLEADRA